MAATLTDVTFQMSDKTSSVEKRDHLFFSQKHENLPQKSLADFAFSFINQNWLSYPFLKQLLPKGVSSTTTKIRMDTGNDHDLSDLGLQKKIKEKYIDKGQDMPKGRKKSQTLESHIKDTTGV